jgi:repressor LexA
VTSVSTSSQPWGNLRCIYYYYTKVHRQPPAEADIAQYFLVSPPSAHQMVVTLDAKGLIERTPGRARSIRLLLARDEIPDLE